MYGTLGNFSQPGCILNQLIHFFLILYLFFFKGIGSKNAAENVIEIDLPYGWKKFGRRRTTQRSGYVITDDFF